MEQLSLTPSTSSERADSSVGLQHVGEKSEPALWMNTMSLVLGDPLDAVRCLKEVSGGDRVVSWLFFSASVPNSLHVS